MSSWLPAWATKGVDIERRRRLRRTAIVLLLLLLGCGSLVALFSHPRTVATYGWSGTWNPDKRLDITGRHGAVASDSGKCSQMGVDVLKKGGNAADAAVTVALCIGSVTPQSSGIGGGSFMLVRMPNGTSFVIDARETAPAGSSKHMFDADTILSKYTGLASGVPGEVKGLETLWELAGGQLPWHELIEPVAELNEKGFPLGEAVAESVNAFPKMFEALGKAKHFDNLIRGSHWCWLFGNHPSCRNASDKGFPVAGSLIYRPQLGHTLRQIAQEGSRAFYHGDITTHLTRATQAAGGILTEEDFANYSVIVRPALQGKFDNHNFITAPAPASGAPLVMGLHVMDELRHYGDAEGHPVDENTRAHRIVEVMKWMAAARSELGDPDFVVNPKIDEIVTNQWAHSVRANISDEHTLDSWRDYHPSYEMNDPHGTTHFSVVDKNGMAVSVTSTVNLPFGNGVCDPHTGVIMNSEMDDFSTPVRRNLFELAPSIYNFVLPGKRPLSSMVPTIMFDENGDVELVIGGAGGSRILTSVFLAICRMYSGEFINGLEAISFPRLHHQLIPEKVSLESGFSDALIQTLKEKGHEVEQVGARTAMNLIHRDNDGIWHAVSDFYRKRGLGAAY